jgi:succinate dehydrogenase flavin-adding protein (antitoxin of CptAB toxin-antitoxin module)
MNMVFENRYKKIKINARRGNLEVDLLLEAFIDNQLKYETNPDAWQTFEALLESDDQTLFDWLLQPDTSKAPYHQLILQIRKNYLISTN